MELKSALHARGQKQQICPARSINQTATEIGPACPRAQKTNRQASTKLQLKSALHARGHKRKRKSALQDWPSINQDRPCMPAGAKGNANRPCMPAGAKGNANRPCKTDQASTKIGPACPRAEKETRIRSARLTESNRNGPSSRSASHELVPPQRISLNMMIPAPPHLGTF